MGVGGGVWEGACGADRLGVGTTTAGKHTVVSTNRVEVTADSR